MVKKSKKQLNLWAVSLAVLIAVLAVLISLNILLLTSLGPVPYQQLPAQFLLIPPGYVQAEADIFLNTVSLTAGCSQLTATVTDAQAEAIMTGLKNITLYRPLTHDMVRDILDFFDIKVMAVRVDRMDNRTYFGRLILQQADRLLSLDVRPSDGIALALRTASPIWVNQTLFEQYGTKIC